MALLYLCFHHCAEFNGIKELRATLYTCSWYVSCVLLVGLEIGDRSHTFDTPDERYMKLIKVCVLLVGLEIGDRSHMFDTLDERYLKLIKVCVVCCYYSLHC